MATEKRPVDVPVYAPYFGFGSSNQCYSNNVQARIPIEGQGVVSRLYVPEGQEFLGLTPVGDAPNPNGATYDEGLLTLEPVSEFQPGVVTTGTQTIAGTKTVLDLLVPMDTGFAFTDGSEYGHLRVVAGPLTEGGYEVRIPDVGPSDFVMSVGNQLIGGQKEFSDGVFVAEGAGVHIVSGEPNIVSIYAANQVSHDYTIPDAGTDADFVMTAGAQTVAGTKTFGSVKLASGGANAITLNVQAQPSYTFTIPNIGANGTFLITDGAQSVGGVKTFNNGLRIGGSGTTLTEYSSTTLNPSTVGVFGSTQNVTVKLVRCGDLVTCWLGRAGSVTTEAAAGSAGTISLSSAFPAQYRPSEATFISIGVKSNSVAETGRIRINPDGTVQIARLNGDNFAATGTAGFINSSFSWCV